MIIFRLSLSPGNYIRFSSEEHNWNMTSNEPVHMNKTMAMTKKMDIVQAIGPSVVDMTSFYRSDTHMIMPSHKNADHGMNSDNFLLQWINVPLTTPRDEHFQYGEIQMSINTKTACETIFFNTVR